jgi:hypothetical protein
MKAEESSELHTILFARVNGLGSVYAEADLARPDATDQSIAERRQCS